VNCVAETTLARFRRRPQMLLKKFDENKEALKQIGREAIAESRRLGLPISARDLQN